MSSAPRAYTLDIRIPGFSLLSPEAEAEAKAAQKTPFASPAVPPLATPGVSSGTLGMAGPSSAFPASGRKSRREEDHFFDSKGGFSSHGKQEAEAEEALEAEALALELETPWQCSACTVINVAARFSCETCGMVNRRRERLRERAAKHEAVVQQRKLIAEQAVLESMKDLDDLSDDDEGVGVEIITIEDDSEDDTMDVVEARERSKKRPRQEEKEAGEGEERRVVARGEASHTGSLSVPLYYRVQGSPVKACSSDLLLTCLSFLADVRSYGRLRGVCKAWAPLAEHEALWRPLAQTLCLPSLRPGHNRKSSSSGCGSGGGEGEGNEQGEREAAHSDMGQAAQPKKAEEEAMAMMGSPATGSGPHKPPSWMCGACGLIQADPHGLFCEFCNTQREIISSPPAAAAPAASSAAPHSYYTKLTSHQDFAAVWGQRSNSSRDAVPLWSENDRREKARAPRSGPAPLSPSQPASSADPPRLRVRMAGLTRDMAWDVALLSGDFYILVKMFFTDTQQAGKWEKHSLHRGWEWLVNAARSALRTRLYSDQDAINARNDSCLPIVESFQKVVNKLTKRDWLLLYECMRTEFALQSEALRRDVMREMRDKRVGEMGPVRGYRLFLEDALLAWDKYQQWVYELDQHFGRLNDQVCGERYRATTAFLPSCGFNEAHTPFLGEGAVLAFRDGMVLHFAMRGPLLRAVEGDDKLPLSVVFGKACAPENEGENDERQQEAMRGGLWEAEREEEEGKLEEQLVLATQGGKARGQGASMRRRRVVENLSDLIERLAKVAEELDVADDPQAAISRRDQYRRLVLMPVRASLAEIRVDSGRAGHVAQQSGKAAWSKWRRGGRRGAEDADFEDDEDRGEALLRGCG